MSKTILLIHGAWLTPLCWGNFRRRYEAAGYQVVAPPWPFEDMPMAQLRAKPDPRLKKLTVSQLVEHYEKVIHSLAEPPILIGHSYGGLIVQKLLDRGLGVAGVLLDSVPMGGVLPSMHMLRSAMPVFLKFFGWNRVLEMSFESFATTFAQTLPEDLKRSHFERYIGPTPGRIYYQGAMGIGMGIKAGNPERPPLLLISGEKDLTITPADVKATYLKQKLSPSLTEMKVFPGRSHFLAIEPGWEEVADYALEWAAKNQQARAAIKLVPREVEAERAIA